MIAAHTQQQHVSLTICYPAHEARADDPHYAAFDALKRRLKAQGLLTCVVCGATEAVEVHHAHVEFSLQNGVDVGRLNAYLGLHLSDADFAEWINSPGNCEPLCRQHHIGVQGVHLVSQPIWECLRVWKAGVPFVTATGNI